MMGSTIPFRGVWSAFRGANARLTKLRGAVAALGAVSVVLAACGGGYGRLSGTPYVADIEPTVARPAFARAPGAGPPDDRSGAGPRVAPDETPRDGGVRPADDLVPDDPVAGGEDDLGAGEGGAGEGGAGDGNADETDLASPAAME